MVQSGKVTGKSTQSVIIISPGLSRKLECCRMSSFSVSLGHGVRKKPLL